MPLDVTPDAAQNSSSTIPENTSTQEKVEKKEPPLPGASAWLKEIEAAEKHCENFWKQGDKIVKRFLDKRSEGGEERDNKLNLFPTNTNILMSTLYARFPKPVVKAEFDDFQDELARVSGMVLERMLRLKKNDDFDSACKACVQDRLVPGQGQVWFRYEPTIITQKMPATAEQPEGGTFDRLVNEEAVTDYVFWRDFLWSPTRRWIDNRWVARRLKMDKEATSKRFGDLIASKLSYRATPLGGDTDQHKDTDTQVVLYAEIFEIWDKRTRKIFWVSKGFEFCLDVKEDPFGLVNFFPCPKPLRALTSNTDQIPRADFLMVQDQYNELDSVNNRITILERAIKMVGVYDGTSEELKQIFTENLDNTLIPLTGSMRRFQEQGGMAKAIDWVPIEAAVNALDKLRVYRQDLIQQIYELTGISDIMRGATKASETLGAQQLKAQYGSVRLQFMQMEVAEFVEEALQIKGEIIARKFQPQTIMMRSNLQNSTDGKINPQIIQKAVDFLKDPMFRFRVEVRADSMAVPEFNAERDARMDFMRAIAEMFTSAAPLLEQSPTAGVIVLQIVRWAAGGFRVARDIEGLLDQAIKAVQQEVQQKSQNPPESPELAVAKQKGEVDQQIALIKGKIDVLIAKIKGRTDVQIAREKNATEAEVAKDKAAKDAEVANNKTATDAEITKLQTTEKSAVEREKISAENTRAEVKNQETMTPVIKAVAELAKSQEEQAEDLRELVESLIQTMSKPRRKTAKRDPKSGEIIEVREEIEP